MKCPKCDLQLDFLGKRVVEVNLESAAPTQLHGCELWRCEFCKLFFAESSGGKIIEISMENASKLKPADRY